MSRHYRYKEHIGRDGELRKKVEEKYEIKGMHNAHVNKDGFKRFLVKVERFENVKNDAIYSQKVNFNTKEVRKCKQQCIFSTPLEPVTIARLVHPDS